MPEPEATPPALKTSEPIFAVTDVEATIRFYREKLGFKGEWLWGTPPTFGAVLWGPVQIMFKRMPQLATKVEGHEHFLTCDDINGLYAEHQGRGVEIVSPIENKPWNLREYTVRDLNGYHLRFAGPPIYQRPATAVSTMPDFIRLVERLPTVDEFVALVRAVQWSCSDATLPRVLAGSIYGVVAIDTRRQDRVVGMIRLVGDGGRFVSFQDVIVIPEFQGQRIGSAMMETAVVWLRKNGDRGMFVSLSTPKPAFYERFGFRTIPGAMSLQL